jgi:hypothetical protein
MRGGQRHSWKLLAQDFSAQKHRCRLCKCIRSTIHHGLRDFPSVSYTRADGTTAKTSPECAGVAA